VTPTRVRRTAAAGAFYPDDPTELAATVDRLLAGATPPGGVRHLLGIVVPHAGYAYSGPVAATAYSLLPRRATMGGVAILGPAHFVPLRGSAVPGSAAWATPLGEVAVDAELREAAVRWGARVDDEPHEPEHAVEVQLPFLQRILASGFTVLPVAVGKAEPPEVASLVAALVRRPGSFVVVSTDLSHYHDHDTARSLDARTAESVLALDVDAVGPDAACGVHALRGLMDFARQQGHAFRGLDLRTSADTAGGSSRVVGYGAFALVPSPDREISVNAQ
jgi:AmmeMemoRadiSam system protein B